MKTVLICQEEVRAGFMWTAGAHCLPGGTSPASVAKQIRQAEKMVGRG
ncbi:MAG TPA: hypothetical protein VKF42_10400 [Chitinivibrionales bacterium]|nr:hypothetical protein [Chitinivibrionales bacterium]